MNSSLRNPRAIALAGAALLLTGGLAACSDDSSTEASSDPITVYSGRSEELVAPIIEAFTEETGIPVEVRYGDSAELAAQIIEEGDASPADVFFAQDAGALGAVANEGAFGALPASTIEAVPADYVGADNTWVGVTGRARVIVFDSETVDAAEVPESVLDLTDPQYSGQVAIAPTNASFQAFVTALRESAGEDAAKEWLEGMVANDVQKYDKNGLILDAVDSGEVTYGLINHYYWFEKADEVGEENLRAQLSFTEEGDPGSLVNVAGVGVLAGSADNADALAFVDYLLSESTQGAFVEQTSEYPLIESVDAPEGLPAIETLQGPDVPLGDLASLPATLALLEEVGLT